MCGRFVLLTDLSRLANSFDIREVRCDYAPLGEVYPGRLIYAVIREEVNRLVSCRWGLVPSWAQNAPLGKGIINARAETVTEKASFRNIFKRQRCLIVADGFYEWEKTAGKSIPHYYDLKSGEPFGMAGLYDIRRRTDGSMLRTCTIITTTSNELIRAVHDRMPAIIPRKDMTAWLDPATAGAAELLALLCPYPAEIMQERRAGATKISL